MLAQPALGAGMQRHVTWRRVGFAHHRERRIVGAFLERDFRFARGERGADVVGHLVGQRGGGSRSASRRNRAASKSLARPGKRALGNGTRRQPSLPMAANSSSLSSIGTSPAASASLSQTLMPSSNTASISPRAIGSRRRLSDGPPQSMRRAAQDSISLSVKPCSANAWSINTWVECSGLRAPRCAADSVSL